MLKNTQENLGHLMAVVFIDARAKKCAGRGSRRTTRKSSTARRSAACSPKFPDHGVNPIEGASSLLLRAGGLARAHAGGRACHRRAWARKHQQGIKAMVFGMLAASSSWRSITRRSFDRDVALAATCAAHCALSMSARADLAGIAVVLTSYGGGREHSDLRAHPRRARNGVTPALPSRRLRARAIAITDSNITALIAGVVLWSFGAAPSGFAVVLVLGIFTWYSFSDGSHALYKSSTAESASSNACRSRGTLPWNFSTRSHASVHAHPQGVYGCPRP